MKYKLTAMVGIHNEAPYLAQWIEFHLLQGFDHFYVYNNGSYDGYLSELVGYVQQGIVDVIDVPAETFNKGSGMWIVNDALARAKRESTWYLATSIDEYTFCNPGILVSDFVDAFTGIGGLAVSWLMFNSSGKKTRGDGLVIDRFMDAYLESTPHIKTIVETEFVLGAKDPHSYFFLSDHIAVNEHRVVVPGAHAPVSHDLIRMHHYWCMSEEEFNVKMNKGRSDIPGGEMVRRHGADDLWAHAHAPASQLGKNRDAQIYSPLVRQALALRALGTGNQK